MRNEPRFLINGMNALLGGGQTYLLNLLPRSAGVPNAKIFLLVPAELHSSFKDVPGVELIDVGGWNSNVLTRFVWENLLLPKLIRRLKIDVYFSTGGLLPLRRPPCKTVSAFRNMLPFSDEDRRKFPLGYKRLRYWLLKFGLSRSFCAADAVIFISRYAKAVIDAALPNRRGLSEVIYHGVGEQHRRTDSKTLARPDRMPEAYVLYVSILNVYKSQLEVVEAWSRLRALRATPEKLVFIGPEFPPYAAKVRAKITELGLQDEVVILGKVPYNELPAYYQNARLNIFASTCENCPNILLEALASGTPVLSSNIEPMPEIAGSGARLFSPHKPDELASALRDVLDNSEAAKAMARRAAQRAADFSWATTRARTWNLLMRLAGDPGEIVQAHYSAAE